MVAKIWIQEVLIKDVLDCWEHHGHDEGDLVIITDDDSQGE